MGGSVAMTIFPGPPGVLAKVWACALLLSVAPSGGAFAQPSSPATGRAELTAYIDGLARGRLAVPRTEVAELKTQAEAEARKARTRATLLKLIGGLPQTRTPLAAKTFGVVQEDGFKVEKITYDSLPGYHVTANVYVPTGGGPFPGRHRRAGPWPGRQARQSRLRGEPGPGRHDRAGL
jgi:hypothetical protein